MITGAGELNPAGYFLRDERELFPKTGEQQFSLLDAVGWSSYCLPKMGTFMIPCLGNKTIFLAGATGMAGTAILNNIIKNCPETRVRASCYTTSKPLARDGRVEYVQGDLRSAEDCRRMVSGCEYAIMAAAYTGGAGFVKAFPWEHVNENLAMNIQMLETFRNEGVKRVVYVGSASLYQEFDGKLRESDLDMNCDPQEPYAGFGWVVRFIEKMCVFLHERTGMEIVMARVSNIYGPYASFNPETSNFIPAIIRKAVERADPFEIWGSPDVMRDVVYVDDFARAVVLMADNADLRCDVFNIGSGKEITVSDVVDSVLACSGHAPSVIRYLTDKPTTINRRVLDCTKAKELIGWEAQYSLDQGIMETMKWWEENRGWWKK